jgi:2-C-methyl-D-erythritol 4-phosphate cytidylyltransferase
VIAAAGSGERLGAGGPKAFVELAGRPLLDYSLDAFKAAGCVAEIVVAVPPGYEEQVASRGVVALTGGEHRSNRWPRRSSSAGRRSWLCTTPRGRW